MADEKLEYLIEVNSKTDGAKASAKAIEANTKAAEKLNEAAKDAVPGLGAASKAIGMLAGGSGVAAGIAAVAAGITVAADGVREFMDSEKAFAKLDIALANSGQLTDAYRERMAKLADTLQDTTNIDGDEWIKAIAKLTQFGADSGNIEKSTDAVKNLAGILGGDLDQAATIVGKAMQGNFEMLSKYGIHVNDAATQTQKFNQACEILKKRGAGQLEGQLQTLGGQMTTLGLNTKDIVKGIGGWVVSTGVMQWVLEKTTVAAKFYKEMLEKIPDKLKNLKNGTKETTKTLEEQQKIIAQLNKEYENLEKNYEKRQKAIDREKSAREKIADAKKGYSMALIDDDLKKGRITEQAALFARAGVESDFEAQKATDTQGDLEKERQNILFTIETEWQKIQQFKLKGQTKNATDSEAKFRENYFNNLEPRLLDIASQMQANTAAYGYSDATRNVHMWSQVPDADIYGFAARYNQNARNRTKMGNLNAFNRQQTRNYFAPQQGPAMPMSGQKPSFGQTDIDAMSNNSDASTNALGTVAGKLDENTRRIKLLEEQIKNNR